MVDKAGRSAQPPYALGRIAAELFAENALGALRDPRSRGAVPVVILAEELNAKERDRGANSGDGRRRGKKASPETGSRKGNGKTAPTTVSRHIRGILGSQSAVPFDLVILEAFKSDRNRQRERWEAALALFVDRRGAEGLGEAERLQEQVLKLMLSGAFLSALSGDGRNFILIGAMLHAAALCHGRSATDESATDAAAAAILDLRGESYKESVELYASGLKFLLALTERRPKEGYDVEGIVVLLHSAFDGYALRHLHDPDRYPLSLLTDALWDITASLTEPGFLATEPCNNERNRLISSFLALCIRSGDPTDINKVADLADVDPTKAENLFPDAKLLANASIAHLLAGMRELGPVTTATAGESFRQLSGLLDWVSSVADEHAAVVAMVPDAAIWQEVRWLVELILVSTGADLDAIQREATAEQLVTAARQGDAGRIALEMVLNQVELHVPHRGAEDEDSALL